MTLLCHPVSSSERESSHEDRGFNFTATRKIGRGIEGESGGLSIIEPEINPRYPTVIVAANCTRAYVYNGAEAFSVAKWWYVSRYNDVNCIPDRCSPIHKISCTLVLVLRISARVRATDAERSG